MKLGIISDQYSNKVKKELILLLNNVETNQFYDLGVVEDNLTSDDVNIINHITSQFEIAFNQYGVHGIVALTTSGNGVQMYANKLPNIIASACWDINTVQAAVREYNMIVCDIPTCLKLDEIKVIVESFISELAHKE